MRLIESRMNPTPTTTTLLMNIDKWFRHFHLRNNTVTTLNGVWPRKNTIHHSPLGGTVLVDALLTKAARLVSPPATDKSKIRSMAACAFTGTHSSLLELALFDVSSDALLSTKAFIITICMSSEASILAAFFLKKSFGLSVELLCAARPMFVFRASTHFCKAATTLRSCFPARFWLRSSSPSVFCHEEDPAFLAASQCKGCVPRWGCQ